MKGFYLLEDPLATKPFRGTSLARGEHRIFRGEITPRRPVVIKHYKGGRPESVIWTAHSAVVLFHERILEILALKNLAGWRPYDVTLLDKNGAEIDGYKGISIVGRCGQLDESKSEEIVDRAFPDGPLVLRYKGYFFDPETWDGSSFFTTVGRGYYIFLDEHARRTLSEAGIRNAHMVPLADVLWDKV